MSTARTWLPFAVFAMLALIGLAFAGTRNMVVRTFSLGAGDVSIVAIPRPHHKAVCEGPVVSPRPFDTVEIWGLAPYGLDLPEVLVKDAVTGRVLARGKTAQTQIYEQWLAPMNRIVPGGTRIDVCVVAQSVPVELLGAPSQHRGIVIDGSRTRQNTQGLEYALVFTSNHGHTFFNSLPLAFSRAKLFRPGWVGSWTFWLLLGAVLATFVLGGLAIRSAAGADGAR